VRSQPDRIPSCPFWKATQISRLAVKVAIAVDQMADGRKDDPSSFDELQGE
jgi:hypothetical protein